MKWGMWPSLLAVLTLTGAVRAGSPYVGTSIGAGVANDNVKSGPAISAYIQVDLSRNVGLRGTFGYFSGDTKVDVLSDGEFTMYSVEASVIFKQCTSTNIVPYAGMGIGYYFPDNDLSSDVEELADMLGLRFEEDIDEDFGFHVLGGLAINIGQNADVDLSVKYIILEPDVHDKVTDLQTFESETYTDDVKLNTLFITAGLRFTF